MGFKSKIIHLLLIFLIIVILSSVLIINDDEQIIDLTKNSTLSKRLPYCYSSADQNNSEIFMNISSNSFCGDDVGCVFVNVSGLVDDVQNVRFNLSWDPGVVNVSDEIYNDELWPMVIVNDVDYDQGFLNVHLFNFSGGYGINLEGEVVLAELCFEAVEGLVGEVCSEVDLTEHNLTTGDHSDLTCTPNNGKVCFLIEDNDKNDADQNPIATSDKEDDSFMIFFTVIALLFLIGGISIIAIIKK